jgi:hypothetical protein
MDARRAVCSDICSSQCRTHAPVAVSVGSDSTAFRNAAQPSGDCPAAASSVR